MQGHDFEKALTRLPEHYRSAIEMIFIDGVSYEMAAEKCRCPLGTLKSRINRARSHLAKDMGYDATWFLSS
nr:RNA polymerase subunit sigma [Rhizobium sp. Q54]